MRHQRRSKRFNRTSSHLKAMLRNMTASLFQHERIVTTPQKAKECRRFAEKLITIAKKGGDANRRRALSILADRVAVETLFVTVAPRFAERQGGYTRILHLANVRLGDAAKQCIFELGSRPRSSTRAPRRPRRPLASPRLSRRRPPQAKHPPSPRQSAPRRPPSPPPPKNKPRARFTDRPGPWG